ncbi:MAG TPA: translation elongation factor 4 [Candidatus Saccharimonadales bacterium]|nr:translation elongation factor 4 [Candidatus Saccharimonadales bacterium]HSX27510.1 translation elongation factor 4 [Patescibacteria group bacterium]
MDQGHIRNFCIIAHIDHGKSTLADRLLELTGTVEKRQMKEQMLDRMELEQERGITIKLAPVRMKYKDYELNLIDTPGHVDFSYEVSRSLQAVEGAILVVDATQGVQAQTLSNIYLALAANLKIIPVLNKIDLPAANVDRVKAEVISLLGCSEEEILLTSAKTGEGVEKVLERVVSDVPPPSGKAQIETRALIFDSYYDDYRGVILYIRVVDGRIAKSVGLKMMATNAEGQALEVGSLNPDLAPAGELRAGEIGYIVTNLKSAHSGRVGDTVTLASSPAKGPLPGYKDIHPFVYAGFFPTSNEQYQDLKEAVEKLSLSDSSLQYTTENSPVLGFGLRLGFLGLLHMDIVRERLEREYDLDLIVTNPSTDYEIELTNGEQLDIKSASELPDMTLVAEIREPWIKGEIVCPTSYVGAVLQLIVAARGMQKNLNYVDAQLAVIDFEAPLANLITDFYDQLKSVTSGYGSFNYELDNYRVEALVRLDIYVAGEKVDALSIIVHRSEAERIGRSTVEKLKDVIPRQQFKVALQAAIGGKFIAREDISAYRKDVTTGLYGGDVSRKKKQLAKQKKGKERMKRFGKVDIPAEAFAVMLKRD